MKAIIWSKPQCQFCDMAKMLLKQTNIEYEEKMIGKGYTPDDLRSVVPDARSVPQIFLDDEYVGGYTELKNKLQGMELKNAVNA